MEVNVILKKRPYDLNKIIEQQMALEQRWPEDVGEKLINKIKVEIITENKFREERS